MSAWRRGACGARVESGSSRTHETASAPCGAEIATVRVSRAKCKTCQMKFLR
ncbi:MAG: hypothetical protein OJF61_000975 [Rhodanobacteraceae bacterium]|nr:MAG: hypothetical protein OJF61_000975 [Rhodanobacteraceae bacterium]